MHDCANCGMACYCSGDIEDHDTGPEFVDRCTCCADRFEDDFDMPDDDPLLGDCGYPGCCMPGLHFRHECHNAQDVEAWFAEHEKQKPTCTRI
jgi:hypothetical protein